MDITPSPDPAPMNAELREFLAAPVPRRDVPPRMQVAVLRGSRSKLSVSLALFFIVVGLGIFVIQGLVVQSKALRLTRNHIETTGTVTWVEPGSAPVRKRLGREYRFEFVAAGRADALSGTCYAGDAHWQVGDRVPVWYAQEKPSLASIEGAQLGLSPAEAETVAASWAVGSLMALMGTVSLAIVYKRKRYLRGLLVNGIVGTFRVQEATPTVLQVGGHVVQYIGLERVDNVADQTVYISPLYLPSEVKFIEQLRKSQLTTKGVFDPAGGTQVLYVLLVEMWYQ